MCSRRSTQSVTPPRVVKPICGPRSFTPAPAQCSATPPPPTGAGLIDYQPRAIQVSTPRQINSIRGVRVHGRRDLDRDFHGRLPVTGIPQTLLDLAAASSLRVVRRALAQLDYRDQLDLQALNDVCNHGRQGSKRLHQGLQVHQPELARTNSLFEVEFLEFCERWKVPVPNFNVPLHGIKVDTYWPAAKLVVELDGYDNHRSRAQLHNDESNDLNLRSHGFTVRRYARTQLGVQGRQIRDEILAQLHQSQIRRPVTAAAT